MKPNISKIIMNIYLYSQYIIMLINIIFYLFAFYISFIILFLTFGNNASIHDKIEITCIIILSLSLLTAYLYISFFTLKTPKKIINKNPITKLQKITVIIYPIFTIIFYSLATIYYLK